MKNNNPPCVSIIILSWNGEKYIHRCIEHVIHQSYKNIEIILIDNYSTDGSFEKIKLNYPHLTFIENKDNLGFAKGMNQGIKKSKGEYIIALNQDVCLHSDFVSECVRRISLTNSRNIGAIGGRVYSWRGEKLTNKLRPGEGEQSFLKRRFQVLGGVRSEQETFVLCPTGTSTFFRREALDDIHQISGDYYDELFVSGWEDLDLFLRMQILGWSCLFLPSAILWHVGSGSANEKSTLTSKPFNYQVRILRNRYFSILKNLSFHMLFWLLPYLLFAELAFFPYFITRSPKTFIALMYAQWQTIISLPKIIKKRKLIQNHLRTSPYHLKQFFLETL